MAEFLQIHPENPQKRLLQRACDVLKAGGIIVYPTDSSYALACHLDDKPAVDRIRQIRQLSKKHNMTLVCRDLSEISRYAKVGNSSFRTIKSLTPGPYTFLLKATRDVPKRLQHEQRKTIGIRIPDNRIALDLLELYGEPILSSSLILPDHDLPLTEADEIEQALGNRLELIIDGGACGLEATTVLSLENDDIQIVRQGMGNTDWLGQSV